MTAPKNNSNTPQSPTESLTLHCGNNAEVLRQYPDCHFDAIITDPPYGIEFLGKDWDSHTGAVETWQQCLRVLKPGGHLLAFSAARTYHHLATNIESVGFEIRDQLMWIYSSGFPKAQDVGKNIAKQQLNKKNMSLPQEQWSQLKLIQGSGSTGSIYQHPNGKKYRQLRNTKTQRAAAQYGGGAWTDTYEEVLEHHNQWSGWKTALKPAHEPIVMARRPMKGSTKDNVLAHGVGALNIDATRIAFDQQLSDWYSKYPEQKSKEGVYENYSAENRNHKDRPKVKRPTGTLEKTKETIVQDNAQGRYPSNVIGEIADYQKYFYCPKVSRRERHVGFDKQYTTGDAMRELGGNWTQMETASGIKSVMTRADGSIMPLNEVQVIVEQKNIGNNHPTVKPVALMRYLIQLVTPVNSIVLDPFMGSGSTGMAAVELGHTFVGIDLDPAYVEIAQKRITGWCRSEPTTPNPKKTVEPTELWDDLFE